MIKLIFLFAQAYLKEQVQSKLSLLLDLITPLAYSTVYLLQIFMFYTGNSNKLIDLPIPLYVVCFFATQLVVFLTPDRSIRRLRDEIRTAQIDVYLLRPAPFFLFKYFRFFNVALPFMGTIFIIGMIWGAIAGSMTLLMFTKVIIMVIVGTLVKTNMGAAIFGLSFFTNETDSLKKLMQFEEMIQQKPQEVFPKPMQFIFTYILPFIVIHSFIFDVVRNKDGITFWFTTLLVLTLSFMANHIVWNLGFKKYESLG